MTAQVDYKLFVFDTGIVSITLKTPNTKVQLKILLQQKQVINLMGHRVLLGNRSSEVSGKGKESALTHASVHLFLAHQP